MDEGDREAGAPLWTDGDMLLRLQGWERDADHIVKVKQPYAVLGRSPDSDICIRDSAVSWQHLYLHLDPRGLFAVDLMTRTGCRSGGVGWIAGWLKPGDELEIAGRRLEVLRLRIHGSICNPEPCEDSPLTPNDNVALIPVKLEPAQGSGSHWVIGSELAFLGRSRGCAIPIADESVARIHAVLVRTATTVFIVNLVGQKIWVEERPVRNASIIADGELLTIGSTRFTVRLDSSNRTLPQPAGMHELVRLIDPRGDLAVSGQSPILSAELVPADSPATLLAWLVGTIQSGQGEMLRRQGEFQLAMTEMLHRIQQDNATLLNAHLHRIETIDRELVSLRAEIERRGEGLNVNAPPPRAPATPLRIARPEPSENPQETSTKSTAWLLERVSQLENENRSAWKDLFGRISDTTKKSS